MGGTQQLAPLTVGVWGVTVVILLAAILGVLVLRFRWEKRQQQMQWERSEAMRRQRNAVQRRLRAMEAEQQAMRHDWWAQHAQPAGEGYFEDRMP